MVRVRIVRVVPIAPDRLYDSYRDYLEARTKDPDRPGTSRVEARPDGSIRFVTEGTARAGQVRIDGLVTSPGPGRWRCRREIEVDGHPFSWEVDDYRVTPTGSGCEITVESEIHARGPLQEILLDFGRGRLRRERERELDRWLSARSG